jgi:RNA polymerase sigma-70 factor (ECF subfamily)
MDLEEQYDKIYRYCYYKVHIQQIAEDITQETFLRYFKQTTYLDRGKPLAYLYTIAKNLCNDYYARKLTEPLEDVATNSDELNDLVTSLAITESVRGLSEDIQEVILLRFVNDLSIGEICRITGVSRFTVHRRINSGLKQLKALLREEDFR